MLLPGYHIVAVAATVVSVTLVVSQDMIDPVEQLGVDVGVMVGHVVKHNLPGCHLVLVTTSYSSLVTSTLLSMGMEAGMVVEAGWVLSQDQLAQDHLLQGLWGDTRTTCRALILDLTASNSTELFLRFTVLSGLRLRSQTVVVAIGGKTGVKEVLLHHSLRNTIHAIYLAVPDFTLYSLPSHGNARLGRDLPQEDQIQNMFGHELRIVAVPYFPYMDFERNSNNLGNMVKPKDSLDVRIIETFADKLNFTYKIHAEPNRSFGEDRKGNFTGMIGQLQREETDFSTIVAPTPGRLKVVEYLRGYPSDPLTVTSLKPALLPPHLALLRPFEGNLWFALLASVVAWGVFMWLMQRAWWWVAGGRSVRFNTALLFGWGALLEQPPSNPSVNDSGRLLVGWWLVFCLIIDTGFRSSLVSHLTVQGTTKPLDGFEDILERNSWKWAIEPWLYKGATLEYFSKHTSPIVKQIYSGMEVLVADEALKKVLDGGFSLIDHKNYIEVVVASWYTDTHGDTSFYISNKGISVIAAFGWGFRQGAPFLSRFLQLMSRLEDAGLINYWTKEVINRRVKQNRAASTLNLNAAKQDTKEDDSSEVVLGMHHLQGAFYLLILGCSVASLNLLREIFAHIRSSP
ncbi:probable glutamate receptor isoform X2 [Homarus americanus]|uniref:probable glutamate receptor isoform X2 n=1 Tax=Homarus americanus TaxID=6706 RepID=UPI001C442ADE|nr:probable glutamate receptor isoform X2 [Homarus americanus]